MESNQDSEKEKKERKFSLVNIWLIFVISYAVFIAVEPLIDGALVILYRAGFFPNFCHILHKILLFLVPWRDSLDQYFS